MGHDQMCFMTKLNEVFDKRPVSILILKTGLFLNVELHSHMPNLMQMSKNNFLH